MPITVSNCTLFILLEVNHEYIRRVLPKGMSFTKLNEEKIKKLQDNINSIPRESILNILRYIFIVKEFFNSLNI